jgi:hypothetical protein
MIFPLLSLIIKALDSMSMRSKLTDLNKQSKNFNMPVAQEDTTMRRS